MKSTYPPCVIAVVVTLNPEPKVLAQLLKSISEQVNQIFLVDNGSHHNFFTEARLDSYQNLQVVRFQENMGVAHALNIGIDKAREFDAEYVVFFDQDSHPPADMVPCLLGVFEEVRQYGKVVSAVGPQFIDPRTSQKAPFIRLNGCRVVRDFCVHSEWTEADYLITSGSLIPMNALDEIGPMCSELFIDYLDVEWGLRAKMHGYTCIGTRRCLMTHTIGDGLIDIGFRKVFLHSPDRHYYLFRNAVWLYKEEWIDWKWKLADGIRLLARFFLFSLYRKPRLQRIKWMVLGVVDGIRGRMGRLDET